MDNTHIFERGHKPILLTFTLQITINRDSNHCLNLVHLEAIAHFHGTPSSRPRYGTQ